MNYATKMCFYLFTFNTGTEQCNKTIIVSFCMASESNLSRMKGKGYLTEPCIGRYSTSHGDYTSDITLLSITRESNVAEINMSAAACIR